MTEGTMPSLDPNFLWNLSDHNRTAIANTARFRRASFAIVLVFASVIGSAQAVQPPSSPTNSPVDESVAAPVNSPPASPSAAPAATPAASPAENAGLPAAPNPAALRITPTPEGDFPPESLAAVEDFTGLDRPGERDVYFGLLNLAGQVPLTVQRARAKKVAAAGEAAFRADPKNKGRPYSQFADLVLTPGRYRGKPVTMEGYIQKLDRMDAGDNDYGLTDLYQSYLFTPESKGNPVVVVSREVAQGLPRPTKGNATNYIRVTGYFYKVWRYEAERGGWAAPLLIAHRLEYRPPQRGPMDDLVRTGTNVFVVVLFLGLVLAVWIRNRNSQRDRARLRQASGLAVPTTFETPDSTSTPEPPRPAKK
jgi:hypothetical protein